MAQVRGGRLVTGALTVLMLALGSSAIAAGDPVEEKSLARLHAQDPVPALSAATFADPPNAVRPKYRWWLPMAYTEDDQLRRELDDMKSIGAGGVEVASFGVTGLTPDRDFLAEYGWGSPRWAHTVEVMMKKAEDLDLGLDLTIGPKWPAFVPTVTDLNDPRAAQQLVFSYALVDGGTSFDAALPTNYTPAPPSGADRTLINAVVARCAEPGCAGAPKLLDRGSVEDVTAEVGDDGRLTYRIPGNSSDTYAVIAFFQTADGSNRTNLTTSPKTYYLDHLSEPGVRASTDFYDSSILTSEVRDSIRSVGRVDLYEDSLELGNSQKWTWDFVERWEQLRGYDPATSMPALTGAGAQGLTELPFFDFSDGSGARIRTDYRQTFNDVYIDTRLDGLRTWANDRGMALRVQTYGHPVDTPEASMHVDIPEGESLAFNHNIEDYKLLAVGAHLTRNPVVSNECCATRSSIWRTTQAGWQDPGNLHALYRGYAGGVTQVVWHGYPYLTQGPDLSSATSRWPGMSYGGNTSYAEAWGEKGGPNWQDYRAVNDQLARLQLVLRQGQPRFDVAVYWQDFGMASHGTTGAGSKTLLSSESPLAEKGYTYEYLSPAQLDLPSAKVASGRLFPDRGDFSAIVLKDQRTMPVVTARRLIELADAGLPVVFAGALPSATPGFHDAAAEDAELRRLVARLAGHRNVVRVAGLGDVPAALAARGVHPAASHATDAADVTSVRRSQAGTDYYYLFNQASWASEQSLTLRGSGRPFRLDTWTGEITPITEFRKVPGGVVVDVAMEPADTEVIALSTRNDDTFRWRASSDQGPTVAHNEGLGSVALDDWTLKVERWAPGESGLPGDTVRTDLPEVGLDADADGSLPPWTRITPEEGYEVDLEDVSGVGTYTTTFNLSPAWDDVRKARLDLGRVVDAVEVTVNGTQLPPINPQDREHVDVSALLHAGSNTITMRVSSTLLNAVRVAPGSGAASRARMDYGLLGPVRVVPDEARQPTLSLDALEEDLPLAAGGTNRWRVRLTNGSPRATSVVLTTSAADGVTAIPDRPTVQVPARSSVTAVIRLAGTLDAGTTRVGLSAEADNGASDSVSAGLWHSRDLALNTTGSPFPRAFDSSHQDRYPPSFATDGQDSTFWVSDGFTPGGAPTPDEPEHLGVDLGDPTEVRAIRLGGRGEYGVRTYDVQTSLDGQTWTTVAHEEEASKSGTITAFKPVVARYVRLYITRGWYPKQPGNNTQVSELAVYAKLGNLAWDATATASSTHSKFHVRAVNDGSTTGQHDYTVWNAGNGWNDANKGMWPDVLTLTWDEPVTASRVRVFTVDNGTNPAATHGLRDYDVQAFVGGEWRTVATVRGNIRGTIDSAFEPIETTALRLLITDSNDHGYSRVVEMEVR